MQRIWESYKRGGGGGDVRRVRRSEQITALRILKWRGNASGINTSRGNLGISTRSDTNAMFTFFFFLTARYKALHGNPVLKVRDAQAETCFNQHVCVDNKLRPISRFKNTCTAAMGVLLWTYMNGPTQC